MRPDISINCKTFFRTITPNTPSRFQRLCGNSKRIQRGALRLCIRTCSKWIWSSCIFITTLPVSPLYYNHHAMGFNDLLFAHLSWCPLHYRYHRRNYPRFTDRPSCLLHLPFRKALYSQDTKRRFAKTYLFETTRTNSYRYDYFPCYQHCYI